MSNKRPTPSSGEATPKKAKDGANGRELVLGSEGVEKFDSFEDSSEREGYLLALIELLEPNTSTATHDRWDPPRGAYLTFCVLLKESTHTFSSESVTQHLLEWVTNPTKYGISLGVLGANALHLIYATSALSTAVVKAFVSDLVGSHSSKWYDAPPSATHDPIIACVIGVSQMNVRSSHRASNRCGGALIHGEGKPASKSLAMRWWMWKGLSPERL